MAALAEEELIERMAGRVAARLGSSPAAKRQIDNRYVREKEAAAFLGMSVFTLQSSWRKEPLRGVNPSSVSRIASSSGSQSASKCTDCLGGEQCALCLGTSFHFCLQVYWPLPSLRRVAGLKPRRKTTAISSGSTKLTESTWTWISEVPTNGNNTMTGGTVIKITTEIYSRTTRRGFLSVQRPTNLI
jgi:hypothetical protein